MITIKLEYTQLVETILQLSKIEKEKLAKLLEKNDDENDDKPLVHLASEDVLSKDWTTEVEDKAWENL